VNKTININRIKDKTKICVNNIPCCWRARDLWVDLEGACRREFYISTAKDTPPSAQRYLPSHSENGQMAKCYSSLWETHLRATERHPPYGITQCCLPPDTSERAPP